MLLPEGGASAVQQCRQLLQQREESQHSDIVSTKVLIKCIEFLMSHDNLNVASSWILFILFARHTSHDGVKLVEVECSNKFLKKIKMIF